MTVKMITVIGPSPSRLQEISMEQKKNYRGSCHCGKVTFELQSDLSTAVRCNCSLCKRKGFPMALAENFKLTGGGDCLTLYQFNTMAAKHYFCQVCGTNTHHHPRSNPALIRVNVGCLDGVNPLDVETGLVDGAALS